MFKESNWVLKWMGTQVLQIKVYLYMCEGIHHIIVIVCIVVTAL